MASLRVYPDRLEIGLSRAEKVLSLRRDDIVVRRGDIQSVTITEDPGIWVRGVRAPGIGLPMLLAVGEWRYHGGKDFLAVKGRGRQAVVIDIDPSEGVEDADAFSRVILTTPHAARLIKALRLDDSDDQKNGQVI